ncbi:cation diffusion facilitator family transporter [Paenibacillus sp. IHB B 3415]|uniref:cation diffusion facilitator family transporter n=1 Tax=Paenibacillus sp. IHB B 3415 TaxID=867080 RepID=UPI0007C7B99F|nr:cation diffusion facilitator family transporter [Paenibacillus sp. IHB B 3415]
MGLGHGHAHGEHGHSHVGVDSGIVKNKEATRVLMISLIAMFITAVFQAIIVAFSGSVALLADTIHNFGDALTSIPLWIAFVLSRRLPTKRFTYGLNRTEDLAGLIIILLIAVSAVVAGYESIQRLYNGTPVTNLWAVGSAAIIGFIGNELVAVYRIRMGKKIGSAALVADGHHARIDGITSLAVLLGVLGSWLGYPIVDPIVGLGITITIIFIVKDSVKTIFSRLLDGMEPATIDLITASTRDVKGVIEVNEVKARWFGHEIKADLSITVDPDLSLMKAQEIVKDVIHRLHHDIEHLGNVLVHVDPEGETGGLHHSHEALHGSNKFEYEGEERYPFEWAGVYKLTMGDYRIALNDGPDPAMLISLFAVNSDSQDALEAAKREAVKIFQGPADPLASGGILQPKRKQTNLLLNGDVFFTLRIVEPGYYVLFTEHHPEEFATTVTGNEVEVIASPQQAFASAHHHDGYEHGHNHAKH